MRDLPQQPMYALPDHERVPSKLGPTWCCRQCSLAEGWYVEWPCIGAIRSLGDQLLDHVRASLTPTAPEGT